MFWARAHFPLCVCACAFRPVTTDGEEGIVEGEVCNVYKRRRRRHRPAGILRQALRHGLVKYFSSSGGGANERQNDTKKTPRTNE